MSEIYYGNAKEKRIEEKSQEVEEFQECNVPIY